MYVCVCANCPKGKMERCKQETAEPDAYFMEHGVCKAGLVPVWTDSFIIKDIFKIKTKGDKQ